VNVATKIVGCLLMAAVGLALIVLSAHGELRGIGIGMLGGGAGGAFGIWIRHDRARQSR
jgi:hypothetical protein